MNNEIERKSDGNLAQWIDVLEDGDSDVGNAELLMLLIELRARRAKDQHHDQ